MTDHQAVPKSVVGAAEQQRATAGVTPENNPKRVRFRVGWVA